jgi:hypothetical protein
MEDIIVDGKVHRKSGSERVQKGNNCSRHGINLPRGVKMLATIRKVGQASTKLSEMTKTDYMSIIKAITYES